MSIFNFFNKKDIALMPVYLYQSKQVKKNMLRLPEPIGDRQGITQLKSINNQPKTLLKVFILGDSAGAGVGVATQDEAFLGQFIIGLSQSTQIQQQFEKISWQLHATTGHTSFDLLKRLYIIPTQSIDIAVISIGVNDVTNNIAIDHWQENIQSIIHILQRKFSAKHIVFVSIPPMQLMPALPFPLNQLVGKIAEHFDKALKQQCEKNINNSQQQVHYLLANFEVSGLYKHNLFAKDGCHPSALTYQHWSKNVVEFIVQQSF